MTMPVESAVQYITQSFGWKPDQTRMINVAARHLAEAGIANPDKPYIGMSQRDGMRQVLAAMIEDYLDVKAGDDTGYAIAWQVMQDVVVYHLKKIDEENEIAA